MTKSSFLKSVLPLANKIHTSYGSQFEKNPKVINQILDKLNLESYYKSESLQILDIYAGPLIQSVILNERLKPKKHVLLEDRLKFVELYQATLKDHPSMVNYNKNPYKWETFLEMTNEDRVLTPSVQKRDHIHNEFLIAANLTNKKGEQLYVQYLQCIANQNWMQRFGLVKMLVWIPQQTARKLFAPFSNKDRNRLTLLSELATNTKLVATSENSVKKFLPDCIEKFDPVIIPSDNKSPDDLSLVEINPRDHSIDLDHWDFVTQKLMILKSKPVEEMIEILGHGARDWFISRLDPVLLKKKPYELTYLEIDEIAKVFALWPFKPSLLVDFYDENED
ncbi:Mtf1 [Kluyveromyces lactis]|nr:Mtf1 [Kluyveromyces lactis]